MSIAKECNSQNWKHPDELIKLHRLKQKKKQLAARLNQNKSSTSVEKLSKDKASLLEAKISQKRKNPFAIKSEETKRTRTDTTPLIEDDSLLGFVETPPPQKETFVRETPTRPPPAKLVLQPFDPKSFSSMLRATTAVDDDEAALEEQKITKHLPMDWTIKTRVRILCRSELPTTTLKTSQLASGLTSFVRCIDTQNTQCGLDISPATRFNQATYYWQHPHIPWMTLFPRNSKSNNGVLLGERERKALADDWDYSFRGLFQLLRARQCPYFYLCANTFTVLFRAAGTGGCVETHALMSPSTRGIRSALRQEGIEYTMPLKKDSALNKSDEGNFTEESNSIDAASDAKETSTLDDTNQLLVDDDEEDTDNFLENLEVNDKDLRRMQTAHIRRLNVQEMSDDFSENSLLLIEGVECQGFFSFLLNAKSAISNVGKLAGIPPTLIAPVAFPKATMQHLGTRSSKVRMDGVDYNSIEVKGVVLPTFLPYACHLLGETKDTFSATLASNNNTLAFSKATQRLLEQAGPATDETEQPKQVDDDAAGQVFGQENLSDCGLLPSVVECMCRTGQNAVTLLERVCYDKEYGFAWS
ncbi:protein downstream neighbor of son homolog isoform X2 [Rhagoletis pomonella]|uniref:protein downstream neighbor of son homolog isoform X1 n=1 Tax=Rhagoletis pomonella TaxID=28610 RepID=UPI001784FC53|nr:protein downstream neighbor of son homolog isoform X1 [Rhagoletis pomonella]XP_036335440.1 protein downstream neighbor of son homolog isoform X2 [Rhagoletis pomonella]